MQQPGVERREFQRLRLPSPVAGTFASASVSLSEVGILGARIHHEQPLDRYGNLRFTYNGPAIEMRCEIVRTTGDERALISGLRFLSAIGASGDHLREMLAQLVAQVIDTRFDTSATRLRIRRSVDGDKTVRGTDAHFLCYRFENGEWKRRHVFLPEQPTAGFTVARGEDADEMQRLCSVYEASDDEGRRLIRLFAELSVSDALQIPPQM